MPYFLSCSLGVTVILMMRDSSLNNVITPKTRQKYRERQKEKVADYSTTMLYNVLTVRNLLSACFKRLQGQLLRLTTLRCRDEATRTPDPYVPNVVRYQLRYIPIAIRFLVSGCKITKKFLYLKIFSCFCNQNK